MTTLAERVEAAAGPDRELDAEIAVAIKLDCRPNLPDDLEYLSLPNKHDPGPGVTAGHYWFHCRSGMSLRSAPPFTASIETAMTLIPAGKILRQYMVSRFVPHSCEVAVDWAHGGWIGNSDHSFALALTAAALRAREGKP